MRLELIAGKAIFFVNDVDTCYRLKLFLEQFSIPAAVLNAELPANSRQHILQQFNKVGAYTPANHALTLHTSCVCACGRTCVSGVACPPDIVGAPLRAGPV